ncbi:MAG: FAD-dependent oxidoreductase [Segetibacter sp.]
MEEWLNEDEQQYRPADGYGKMIDYLAKSCKEAGSIIKLSTVVEEIRWQKGYVEVNDDSQKRFVAFKALITVPLGIWLAQEDTKGAILYYPAVTAKTEAAKQMGFGSAIKILLEFKEIFWEDDTIKKQTEINTGNFQFILSDLSIPTWWTQLPQHKPMLTGWLSGPEAEKIKNEKDEVIILKALNSLSIIFKTERNILREKLKWWKVFNWANDPFALGSYSYSTMETAYARRIVMEPIENTLFFAGEALYERT